MNLNLNETIALISVLLPLLIPVGQALYAYLLQHLPQAQQKALTQIGATVVAGVEQQSRSRQITPDQRKAEAVAAFTEIAKAAGIKVSPAVVSLLIEAAVDEYKQLNESPLTQTIPAAPSEPVPAV